VLCCVNADFGGASSVAFGVMGSTTILPEGSSSPRTALLPSANKLHFATYRQRWVRVNLVLMLVGSENQQEEVKSLDSFAKRRARGLWRGALLTLKEEDDFLQLSLFSFGSLNFFNRSTHPTQ
jgi:hypothetical protein